MKNNPYVIAFFKLHKFVFNWVCNNVATEDENIFPKPVSKVVGHGNEPNKWKSVLKVVSDHWSHHEPFLKMSFDNSALKKCQ